MALDDAPLTLALAMMCGIVAQIAGRHARIPGIVLLLGAGVALGPDGAGLIRPAAMGAALPALVGFAIAVILFEGGLSMRLEVLRQQAVVIRRLVTVGALITAVLATVSARLFMPWDWRLAILFGALVIVTGPTVVTPLVRRLRLTPAIGSILIAEGVFIDAVGATLAAVALDVLLAGSGGEAVAGGLSMFLRVGTGAAVGAVGGLILVGALRGHRLVPHGLENMLVLATSITTFQIANSLVSESGITAAIVAGMVVGNLGIRRLRAVAEFKEELTYLLVATLFVLLSADVRMRDVASLGWGGAAVVALLMVVVRPAAVAASTRGSELTRNERLYLAWLAPRGIVAAAVASLFASELAHEGVAGGEQLRALVFVVIVATVVVQGLSASLVATLLGVRRPARTGYLVVGANPLARVVGEALLGLGQRVSFVDSNDELCRSARKAGHAIVQGDALDVDVLVAAELDSVECLIALTPNENVNFLVCRLVEDELPGARLAIALEAHDRGVTANMAERHDMAVLFAGENDLLGWVERARHRQLELNRWILDEGHDGATALAGLPGDDVLLIALVRGARAELLTSRTAIRPGDELVACVPVDARERALAWSAAQGWRMAPPAVAAPPP